LLASLQAWLTKQAKQLYTNLQASQADRVLLAWLLESAWLFALFKDFGVAAYSNLMKLLGVLHFFGWAISHPMYASHLAVAYVYSIMRLFQCCHL
jgi:hypothetical protein